MDQMLRSCGFIRAFCHYLDLASLDRRFLVRTGSFDPLTGFSGSFSILRRLIPISSAIRSRLFANPSTSDRNGSGSSLARMCSCSASFSNFSRRARNNSSSSRLVIAIFRIGFRMFVHKCIIQGLGPAGVQCRLGAAGLSDRYIFELKVNGFRALAHIDAGQGQLISRNGNTFRGFADLAT